MAALVFFGGAGGLSGSVVEGIYESRCAHNDQSIPPPPPRNPS